LAYKNFAEQAHPSKQQPYKFSEFSVLSVDKKWVVGVSQRQAFSCGSWLKNGYAKPCKIKKGIARLRFTKLSGCKGKSAIKCAEISKARALSIHILQIGYSFYGAPT